MTAREDEVQIFKKGEHVMCYEPDPMKARVLYNSKVLEVYERKDEQGLKYYNYKIHFTGWSSSYDRAVRANVLLKNTEENLNLQRELAIAAKLQIGAYSYRDPKAATPSSGKKKKSGKAVALDDRSTTELLDDTTPRGEIQQQKQLPAQQQQEQSSSSSQHQKPAGGESQRDSSAGRKTLHAHGDATMRNSRPPRDPSHTKSTVDERIVLRISERLREYMEADYKMIVKLGKQHKLPARVPIVTIFENFVKQRAVEMAISIKQDSSRGRNTQSRNARMEREYDRVMSHIVLLKEVVDGLRIYFEFMLDEHLLYKEEKDYVLGYLTDDNMRNCSMILNNSFDFINPNCDSEQDGSSTTASNVTNTNGNDASSTCILGDFECEKQLHKCLQYIERNNKNISGVSFHRISPYFAACRLPMEMRGFLRETFKWKILTAESPPEKSMIFGAPHLARLLIKMPEFLNASIEQEQIEDLLPHLDTFINFLENHKEWFEKNNYTDPAPPQEQLQKDLLESLDHEV